MRTLAERRRRESDQVSAAASAGERTLGRIKKHWRLALGLVVLFWLNIVLASVFEPLEHIMSHPGAATFQVEVQETGSGH